MKKEKKTFAEKKPLSMNDMYNIYDDDDIPPVDLPKGVNPKEGLEVSPPWKEEPGNNS